MVADKIYDILPSTMPKVVGELPSVLNDVVAIVDVDGYASTEYFGFTPDQLSLFEPLVKVIVRTGLYETGNAWLTEIRELLHRYHDDYFLLVLVVGAPMYLGKDEQKLHQFQLTLRTQVKE